MRIKSVLAALAAVCLLPAVLAHAVVRTEMGLAESKAGASETYRLQVPVEKGSATTEVRLVVPDGFTVSDFFQMPGWTRSVKRDTANNNRITEVTWRGRLQPEEVVRFMFRGRNPAQPGALSWKVYQRYADGSVVSWDDSSPDTPASKVEIKQ